MLIALPLELLDLILDQLPVSAKLATRLVNRTLYNYLSTPRHGLFRKQTWKYLNRTPNESILERTISFSNSANLRESLLSLCMDCYNIPGMTEEDESEQFWDTPVEPRAEDVAPYPGVPRETTSIIALLPSFPNLRTLSISLPGEPNYLRVIDFFCEHRRKWRSDIFKLFYPISHSLHSITSLNISKLCSFGRMVVIPPLPALRSLSLSYYILDGNEQQQAYRDDLSRGTYNAYRLVSDLMASLTAGNGWLQTFQNTLEEFVLKWDKEDEAPPLGWDPVICWDEVPTLPRLRRWEMDGALFWGTGSAGLEGFLLRHAATLEGLEIKEPAVLLESDYDPGRCLDKKKRWKDVWENLEANLPRLKELRVRKWSYLQGYAFYYVHFKIGGDMINPYLESGFRSRQIRDKARDDYDALYRLEETVKRRASSQSAEVQVTSRLTSGVSDFKVLDSTFWPTVPSSNPSSSKLLVS